MPELSLENSIVDERYLVERRLSRGSYAEVYLAYDQAQGGHEIIIKALNTSLQGTPDPELDWTLVENFQNEAIALDRVRHPNIIKRIGHGTAADLSGVPFHYLVLEYMPGGDMMHLSRRRLTIDEVVFYFRQVAEALAHAHACQVIHRDIKPTNLLLSADRRVVKVADFGVAKMSLDDSSEITLVGTHVYAPPEHHPEGHSQELNEKLTPAADVYSLAKTIYVALTGKSPSQFARRPIDALPAEIETDSWAPAMLNVLRTATATRAADRHQTVEDFWSAFSRAASPAAADPEATIVRSRLKPAAGETRPHESPDFQPLHSRGTPTHPARIIVELPSSASPAVGAGFEPRRGPASPVVITLPQPPAERAGQTRSESSVEDSQPQSEVTRKTRRTLNLRAVLMSEWLRRVFLLFLLAAMIGLTASVYFFFAERGRSLPDILTGLDYRDGSVANALNVNLRSEPGGIVVGTLPSGTRVRVYENRGGWVRVRVLRWEGQPPPDTASSGWLDGRFVRFD